MWKQDCLRMRPSSLSIKNTLKNNTMKTSRKTLMIILAVASLTLGVLAATGAWYQPSPDRMIDRMKDKLGLTNAQVSEIKIIYSKHEATLKADREAVSAATAGSAAKKAASQKMRADMEQVQAQFRPILTPDQQVKWDQFRADQKKRREEEK